MFRFKPIYVLWVYYVVLCWKKNTKIMVVDDPFQNKYTNAKLYLAPLRRV